MRIDAGTQAVTLRQTVVPRPSDNSDRYTPAEPMTTACPSVFTAWRTCVGSLVLRSEVDRFGYL